MRSRTPSALAWSLLVLLALGLAAYWLPWIDHRSAALKLSGQDLGEFVKFLPEIRTHIFKQVIYNLSPILHYRNYFWDFTAQ